MGRQQASSTEEQRYLQTRNPTKLEENDLKRALEASLEECPDFWPEDTASCSSSEQSNATTTSSSSTSSSTGNSIEGNKRANNSNNNRCISHLNRSAPSTKRRSKSMQQNHLNCSNPSNHSSPHNHQHNNNHQLNQHLSACCPLSSVHNRYKPVAKKNIYDEADFFHEGIMEYIEYELSHSWSNKKHKNKH